MCRSIEVDYLKETSIINYDDTIAYSLESVKYPGDSDGVRKVTIKVYVIYYWKMLRAHMRPFIMERRGLEICINLENVWTKKIELQER